MCKRKRRRVVGGVRKREEMEEREERENERKE